MNDWHDDEDITVNRNSFVFYDSFYRAMDYLTEEEKMEYIDAICHYSLYDIRIEMSLQIEGMFELAKAQINTNPSSTYIQLALKQTLRQLKS